MNALNARWLAGITYVPTWEGRLYLAAVVGAHTKACIAWSMRNDLSSELVVAALGMAATSCVEGFYNPHRRHSAIGYLSPIEYETMPTREALGFGH